MKRTLKSLWYSEKQELINTVLSVAVLIVFAVAMFSYFSYCGEKSLKMVLGGQYEPTSWVSIFLFCISLLGIFFAVLGVTRYVKKILRTNRRVRRW